MFVNNKFFYTSGSHKNTDRESLMSSHIYYFDIPRYLRLSEEGYKFSFNQYQKNKGMKNENSN